jgi:resuscitation-promoting factor RpfA
MDKSPDAFRTISEVAEHLETPAHVLRFWESRFPQIRPVKRAGGRRYYRPSDISLLTGIKRLLHDEGMTIRGVQKILREQGVRHVSGLADDADHDGADGDAPFTDQVDDAVVPPKAEPTPIRAAPSFAHVMAKANDQGADKAERQPPAVETAPAEPEAEATPPAPAEPLQGTLLLTPTPEPQVEDAPTAAPDTAVEADVAAIMRAAQDDDPAADARAEPAEAPPAEPKSAFPESRHDDDFDEDDFDDGPITTLATRIRALPDDASARKVAVNLVALTSRLQALRDRMADAGRTG